MLQIMAQTLNFTILCLLIYFLSGCHCESNEWWQNASSIFDFEVEDIHGNKVSLDKYRGKVVLIVNVASQCGYTDGHYTELNKLYSKYSKDLAILAFPCNQFAYQEPGDSKDILKFSQQREVKFDIFGKIEVNGDEADPLFKYLKLKQGGILGNFIKWNFTKFLVNKQGIPVDRQGPNVSPLEMEENIKSLINENTSGKAEL